MRIYTGDKKRILDIGTGSIWYSIYSTALVAFSTEENKPIELALAFFRTGECSQGDLAGTITQLRVIYKVFSTMEPRKAIYDYNKPDAAPPWGKGVSSNVKSCANLYTTADGKDLFTELFALLSYAKENKVAVYAG